MPMQMAHKIPKVECWMLSVFFLRHLCSGHDDANCYFAWLRRSTWDVMMHAGKKNAILWMAHALPLYAIRFALQPSEAMQVLASLKLEEEWVTGSRKTATMRQVVRDVNPCFFRPWVLQQLGTVGMNAYDVPELQ